MKGWKSAAIRILLLAISLGGCAEIPEKSEPVAPPPEVLQFRITWKPYSGRGEVIQRIVDSYNSSGGQRFSVQLAEGDEDFGTTREALASPNGPDIYVLPYRYIRYFGERGEIADLSGDFGNDRTAYYESIWKLGTVEERVYGIPWLGHSMCLIYNQDLLRKAGIDGKAITDMDSLLDAMAAVEARTTAKGIGLVGANHNDVSWMVNQFISGYGSPLVDASGRKVAVNNEKARAALSFYRDVLGGHAQPGWQNHTGVEVMEAFRNQEVAFEFQGIWGVTDIWKNGREFSVGVISPETVGLHSEVGPMMLALPARISPEKRAGAVDFIRYLISAEAQARIMDGEYSPEHDAYYPFRVPVRKDLTEALVFQKYPEFVPFLKGFENPSVDVPVPGWQLVKEQYYAPGLHEVMTGTLSIDDFLKRIETEGNRILAEDSR